MLVDVRVGDAGSSPGFHNQFVNARYKLLKIFNADWNESIF